MGHWSVPVQVWDPTWTVFWGLDICSAHNVSTSAQNLGALHGVERGRSGRAPDTARPLGLGTGAFILPCGALPGRPRSLKARSSFCSQTQLSPETRTRVPLEILLHSDSSCWKAEEETGQGSLVHLDQPRSGMGGDISIL